MATVAPTGGWSSTVPLTAGASYLYTATPGANGTVIMQWTDGTNWFTFGNSAIGMVSTGKVPAAATGIRGQGVGAAGTFEAVRDVFSPAVPVMWVPIFPDDLSSPSAEMLADTSAVYELQTTKALYRSNGVSLELYGTGSNPIDDYYDANGTTYTLDANELNVKTTNAAGCAVVIPTGLASGTPFVIAKRSATGSTSIDRAGSTGVTIYPSGTLAVANDGAVMCVTALGGDVVIVTGYDPAGGRRLGSFTWAELIAAYPVNDAAITALGEEDYAWCSTYKRRFVPNAAKTRMVLDNRRIVLGQFNTTLADAATNNKVGTGVTATTKFPLWASIQMPGYLAQPGDWLLVRALGRKVGTGGACQLDVKLGTTDSATDQTIAKVTIANTNNQDGYIDQSIAIYDATTLVAVQESISNSSSTNKQNTPSTAVNSLQYAAMYVEGQNTLDYIMATQFIFELVQAQ